MLKLLRPSRAAKACYTTAASHNRSHRNLAKSRAETLHQLNYLSDQLYIESAHNKYKYLQPPQQYKLLTSNNAEDPAVVNDWNEVLGILHEMNVVPEMADQLSGAIYMHALMQEDICSKCIRLADWIAKPSHQNIMDILNNVALWKLNMSDIKSSDMVQLLLSSLDARCSSSQSLDLSLTFALCRVLRFFQGTECKSMASFFDQMKVENREDIVTLLLAAAYCHNATNVRHKVDHELMRLLTVRINLMFEELSPTELAACYAGLQSSPSSQVDELGQKITNRYGFRL